MYGVLGLVIFIIICFTIFIVWAKTAAGKKTLHNTLGDPHAAHRKHRVTRKKG